MNVLPTLLAATPSLLTLDLTSGPIGQYLGVTRGLAWGLFVFALVLALVVEAFGRNPTEGRDYGGVAMRAVVVLVLLTFYAPLFGSLFSLAEGIATRVAPNDLWDRFTRAQDAWIRQAESRASPAVAVGADIATGFLFDSLLALTLLLGQASLWIVNTFGRVLAALLYVLGPLTLVFSVIRGVDSGKRWFRTFVSVLCWPILSALLVSLTVAFGLQSSGGGSSGAGAAFESVALAGLMAVISVAVPLVASSLVGGGMGAVGSGAAAIAAWAGPLAQLGLPHLSRQAGDAAREVAKAAGGAGEGGGGLRTGLPPAHPPVRAPSPAGHPVAAAPAAPVAARMPGRVYASQRNTAPWRPNQAARRPGRVYASQRNTQPWGPKRGDE